MELECLPLSKDSINSGFSCKFIGDFSDNNTTMQHIGTAPNDFYVENSWSNGDLMIALLLLMILGFTIIKYGFNVFYPKIMEIKKYKK